MAFGGVLVRNSTRCTAAARLWWRKACPLVSACTGSSGNSPRASDGPCRTDPKAVKDILPWQFWVIKRLKSTFGPPKVSLMTIWCTFQICKLYSELASFMQLHPVWYFKWCYPVAAADGFLALLAGVGVQALIALHTVRVFLTKNILLPKQRLLTVVAVISLCHLYFCLSVLWWRVWVWGDVWKRQNLWEDECNLYVYIFFSSYH